MGLMVGIANVRSNPRFSMLRCLTENVVKAVELTAGLLDWLCWTNIKDKRRSELTLLSKQV
jgi:hypothetical protein